MLVSDVLRHKGGEVITVHATDRVSTAVKKFAARRIGAVIVDDQRLQPVGIFSERDLVNALARSGPAAYEYEVRELMTSPFISTTPTERIDAVLALMTTQRIRHLPVVDGGRLVGLVSIGDLVKHRLDEKELEASVLLDIARMRA